MEVVSFNPQNTAGRVLITYEAEGVPGISTHDTSFRKGIFSMDLLLVADPGEKFPWTESTPSTLKG